LGENGIDPAELAVWIWRGLEREIREHLRQDGLTAPEAPTPHPLALAPNENPGCVVARERLLADAPFFSVVVATRDRPESLANCLCSLTSLEYPRYEILVVDNAPSTPDTAALVQGMARSGAPVRYLQEQRRGLSWARNHGLRHAKGELVAFTDDDVVADRYWLASLAQGFRAADGVACVTGLVLPLELETPAQIWFEQYSGFSRGFTRRVFDLGEHRPKLRLYPYAAAEFGAGANMAFKTSVLRTRAPFDPALGAGSPARGGEDLAAFFQVVADGHRIVYEPSALVRHLHRRDYPALRKQAFGYGVGLTSYLTKLLIDRPRLLLDLAQRIPYGAFYSLRGNTRGDRRVRTGYPKELMLLELIGMLYGPLAYLRGRWRVSRGR
jgi:glycosyltransferase involved in cell wall biosynthesis